MGETIVQGSDDVERKARHANRADLWDSLWNKEGDDTWRTQALERIYQRIADLLKRIPRISENKSKDNSVVDIGGGRGILAAKIADECALISSDNITVVDHSEVALSAASQKSIRTLNVDLEKFAFSLATLPNADLYVSTECFEHLSERARDSILDFISSNCHSALISVPNNRLGPEEEPQHTIKFNAMSFKETLERHFEYVRVEVFGPFLLGVCGTIAKKGFTLSATLPVRDEGKDLEPVIASLRGIADQLVVGIDPRTKDDTWKVAELYADKVFYLKDPMGPPNKHEIEDCPICDGKCKEYMGENGVNFGWIRNQCINQCTGEWIFMTEGHERLVSGFDALLNLDLIVPEQARVGFVLRQGNGQQWGFPWLFKNADDIYFNHITHQNPCFGNSENQKQGKVICRKGDIPYLRDK